MARPSKLTAETRRAILTAIAAGIPEKYAAERAGVNASTLRRWKARGRRQKRGEFRAFCAALKKARAEAVAARLCNINAAAKEHWQAAAWWLERTCPEHFALNRRELRELRKQLVDLQRQVAELRRTYGRDTEAPAQTA